MKTTIRRVCALIVLGTLALPLYAADSKHDEWIVIESMQWSTAKVGQPVRMQDGNYRNAQGQYLVVERGKVTDKGPDYRKWKPKKRTTRKSGNESAAISSLRTVVTTESSSPQSGPSDVRTGEETEQAGLLLPAVQKVRASAAKPGSGDTEDIGTPSAGPRPSSGPTDDIGAPAATRNRGIEHDDIGARSATRNRGIEHEDIGAPNAAHETGGTEYEDSWKQQPAARGIEEPDFGAPKANNTPEVQPDPIGKTDVRGSNKPGGGMTGQSRRRGGAVVEDVTLQSSSRISSQQMMLKLQYRPTRVTPKPSTGTSPSGQIKAPGQVQDYEIADCGTPESPMICCHHEPGDGSTCNMFKMLCKNAGGTAEGDQTDATCSDWP